MTCYSRFVGLLSESLRFMDRLKISCRLCLGLKELGASNEQRVLYCMLSQELRRAWGLRKWNFIFTAVERIQFLILIFKCVKYQSFNLLYIS